MRVMLLDPAQRIFYGLMAGTILFVLILAVAAPLAHSAPYNYVNNVKVPEYTNRYSNTRATLNGGTSNMSIGIGTHTIKFYKVNPYRSHTTATGIAGVRQNVSFNSDPIYGGQSLCYWGANGKGGSIYMTCSVRP